MSNSLSAVHPELVAEWSDKNFPLTPDSVTFGSNKKVWWKGACGIMNNDFFVLIAAIAIFDILPVAGSCGILIPCALFSLVYGNNRQAVGLIVIYVVITVIRQYIKPKIVGSSLGVNPIVTLMGIYFGLKFFGFLGMFLVPLCVMTLKAFNDAGRINIWKTSPENKIDVPKA